MIGLLSISTIITGVSFLFLQHSNRQTLYEQDGQSASQNSNIPTLVVIFLVSLIASYWINGMFEGNVTKVGGVFTKTNGGGASISDFAYENGLVSRIHDNCITGAPPF